MSYDHQDRRIERLLRRSLIAEGHRPSSDHDIERMLDALRGEQPSADTLARLLRKVNREEPVFDRPMAKPVDPTSTLSTEERQLVALYRSQGKAIPPEIERKLKEMEDRAARPADPEEDDESGTS